MSDLIEIEPSSCNNSDYDTDYSDTTSLSSTLYEYVYENGRRYGGPHAEKYMLPNDQKEENRLDLRHHLWNLGLQGNSFFTNIEPLLSKAKKEGRKLKVLDLGTGTGNWAVELADTFPDDVEVVGTDITLWQPVWVPPNVKFEIEDFNNSTWTFAENQFDIVHGRNLIGSVCDWHQFMTNVHQVLAPGGFVELQETHITGAFSEDKTIEQSIIPRFSVTLAEAATKLGNRMDIAPELLEITQKAGFPDATQRILKSPMGVWPKNSKLKEMGAVGREIFNVGGAESYGLALFTRVLGMPVAEAKALFDQFKVDINNVKIHTIYPEYIIVGYKAAC